MKTFVAAVTTMTLIVISYQHCSVSSDGGVGNLGSNGGAPTLPVLALDLATLILSASQTSFSVSGGCSLGPYTDYSFEASFQETGASSASTRSYNSSCSSGRFSISVSTNQMNIRANYTGVLTVRIRAIRPSGDVESLPSSMNIAWGGSSTGATTSTSTGGSTGNTTGCSPTCDPNRTCGSTIDSCGTNTCAAQTTSPPCPPPPGSGCVTLRQNIICVDCGNYGQTVTANAEECRVHCGSRSKCCEWDSNNGNCTYYLHNVPVSCRTESANYPNIWSGLCY